MGLQGAQEASLANLFVWVLDVLGDDLLRLEATAFAHLKQILLPLEKSSCLASHPFG